MNGDFGSTKLFDTTGMRKKTCRFIVLTLVASICCLVNTRPSMADGITESVKIQAIDVLRANSIKQGFEAGDLSELEITNAYRSDHNGVNHVYVRQKFNDIPVSNAVANLNLRDDGELYDWHSCMVKGIATRAGLTKVRLNAIHAVSSAADDLGVSYKRENLQIKSESEKKFVFEGGEVSQYDIPVDMEYYAKSDKVNLTWKVVITPLGSNDLWYVWVDTYDGHIVEKNNLTSYAIYHVFDLPKESPLDGGSNLVVDPQDIIASPYGWHDTDGVVGAESTRTSGNNVVAQEDTNGDNMAGRSPDGGDELSFIYSFNLETQRPLSYENFAITNLFYLLNVSHDIFYHYGFDEAAGNFQQNNYGRSGIGNDPIIADALDSSSANNASYTPAVEGESPRIQVHNSSPPIALFVSGHSGYSDVTVPVTLAQFGEPLEFEMNGDAEIYFDSMDSTHFACGPPAGILQSRIPVIDIGLCSPDVKALNIQKYHTQPDAIAAMIIINDQTGSDDTLINNTLTLFPGDFGDQINFPVGMVSRASGDLFRARISEGTFSRLLPATEFIKGRALELDAGVVVHEYGHGVVSRLTGGASNINCTKNEQTPEEGWSDFFALAATAKPTDTADTPRGIGQYAFFRDNAAIPSIRLVPYTRDLNINGITYDYLREASAASVNNVVEIHEVGTVFASALWDMYWNLVDRYGYSPDLYNGSAGNQLAIQLVVDGLKMQPCKPNFTQARNAILRADTINNVGVNTCAIWDAFARRGIGVGAIGAGPGGEFDVTVSKDVPLVCINPDVLFTDGLEREIIVAPPLLDI